MRRSVKYSLVAVMIAAWYAGMYFYLEYYGFAEWAFATSLAVWSYATNTVAKFPLITRR